MQLAPDVLDKWPTQGVWTYFKYLQVSHTNNMNTFLQHIVLLLLSELGGMKKK